MALARDPETGEYLYWTGSDWVPAKLAEDPDTKERLAWDGSTWKSLGKTPSGFGAAFSSGVDTLQQSLYSAGEGGAKALGLEGLAKFAGEGAARNRAEAQAALPAGQTFEDAKSLSDYWTAAKESLGTSLPQMAPVAAGALAGSSIGTAIAPGIGSVIGGVIGGTAGGFPLFFGSNREAQKNVNEGVVKSEGAAALAALPQAAMDSLLQFVIPGFGKAVTGNLLTRVVKKGAEGLIEEVPTEIGQQVLERYQAGLPIADEEAIRQYKEVAKAAGVLGGGAGVIGGGLQKKVMTRDELARLAGRTQDDQLAQNIEDARAGVTPTPPPAAAAPTSAGTAATPPGTPPATAPATAPDATGASAAPTTEPDSSATAPEPEMDLSEAINTIVNQHFPDQQAAPAPTTGNAFSPEQINTYISALEPGAEINVPDLARAVGADTNALWSAFEAHPDMAKGDRGNFTKTAATAQAAPVMEPSEIQTVIDTILNQQATEAAATAQASQEEPAVEPAAPAPAPALRKPTAEEIRQRILSIPEKKQLNARRMANEMASEGISVDYKTIASVGYDLARKGYLGRDGAHLPYRRTAKPYVSPAEAKAAKAAAAQATPPAAIEPSSEEVVNPADFAPAQPEPVANPLPAQRRAAAQAKSSPPVAQNQIADVVNQYIDNMAPGDRVKADDLARELNANAMSFLDAFEANPNVIKGDMFYFTKVGEQAAPAAEVVPQEVQSEPVAATANPLPAERRAAAKAKTTKQKAAKTPAQKRAAAAAPVVTPAPTAETVAKPAAAPKPKATAKPKAAPKPSEATAPETKAEPKAEAEAVDPIAKLKAINKKVKAKEAAAQAAPETTEQAAPEETAPKVPLTEQESQVLTAINRAPLGTNKRISLPLVQKALQENTDQSEAANAVRKMKLSEIKAMLPALLEKGVIQTDPTDANFFQRKQKTRAKAEAAPKVPKTREKRREATARRQAKDNLDQPKTALTEEVTEEPEGEKIKSILKKAKGADAKLEALTEDSALDLSLDEFVKELNKVIRAKVAEAAAADTEFDATHLGEARDAIENDIDPEGEDAIFEAQKLLVDAIGKTDNLLAKDVRQDLMEAWAEGAEAAPTNKGEMTAAEKLKERFDLLHSKRSLTYSEVAAFADKLAAEGVIDGNSEYWKTVSTEMKKSTNGVAAVDLLWKAYQLDQKVSPKKAETTGKSKKQIANDKIEALYDEDNVNKPALLKLTDEFEKEGLLSPKLAAGVRATIKTMNADLAASRLSGAVTTGELSTRSATAPETAAAPEAAAEAKEKTKKKRTKRRKSKGKKKSAAAPKTEETVEPPTPKTPEELAEIEERRVNAQKFLDDRLAQMEASGQFGQKAAAAVREVLSNGDISHTQAHHAFMMAEISSKLLKGTGANPDIKFLTNVDYDGRRLRQGHPDALAGLIEFSLNDNPESSVLGYSKETAAHEPFHVLQDLMEEYDPATSKILFGTRTGTDPETGHGIYKGGAFRDGMTPKDIPSSIRRTLEALSPEANGGSYWSRFVQDYNNAPETPVLDKDGNPKPNLRTEFAKQREAMAYVFGMLADAKSRGFNTNAMDAPFKRFLHFLTQFREKMGNFLRGKGYESTDQVLEDYISGERQQGYGGEVDRTGKSEYSYVGKGAKNWSRETQARAETLEEQGATPDTIYFETGLHRGLRDGEWRAEVPDTDIALEEDGLQRIKDGEKVGLRDVFSHPELFENYPSLVRDQIMTKNIPSGKAYVTTVRGREFSYNVIEVSKADVNAAMKGNPDTLLDALVHEVQHIIQDKEDFSPGVRANEKLKAEVFRLIKNSIIKLSDDVVDSVSPNIAKTPEVAAVIERFRKDLAAKVEKWKQAYSKDKTGAHLMYMAEVGERESRSVEARRKMTPGERRATLPDAIAGQSPYVAEGPLQNVLRDPAYRNHWKKLIREAAAKAAPARIEGEFSVRGGRLSKDAELAIRSAQAQSTGKNLTISNRIKNTLKKAFDPLAMLTDRKRYMIMRYLAMGTDTALQDEAKGFYDKISALPEAQQQKIYDYLTTRGAVAPNLSPEVRKLAIDIKTRINNIGDRMVQRGMISKESLAEYKDQYLPRIYMKYLMEGKPMVGTGLRAGPQGQLKQRKDFSEEDRVAMGEVTNPGFLSYMALYRPERDMVMHDFLSNIANASDVDWVWPQSVINYKGMKVTSFWLVDEANAIRQRMKLEPDKKKRSEMKRIAEEMQDLADPHIGELIPDNYKQLPKSARYGALKGMVVRQEIYDDIVGSAEINPDANFIDRTFGDRNSTLAKGTAFWKMTKTILNPPTQVRNFISNAAFLNLSGVSPFMVGPRILQAMKEMRTNGPAWQIAKKYGVKGAGFGDNELKIAQDIMEEYLSNNKTGIMNPALIGRMFATIATKAGNAYQWSEHVFKTAKIIDELEKNNVSSIRDKTARERAEGEAALEGHKWFFDYSLVPPSIKSLRTMPFGAPFITYYYKALPLMVEVLSNPRTAMRFAPYIALQMAMPALVASMYDADDDDVDKIKMSLSEHLRENGSLNIFPFKDQNNNWQFLDWGYFFPWQMFVNTGQALAKGDVAGALSSVGALSSPALSAVTAIKTNIDPFTGREIINKADPPHEQMMSFLKYIAQLALPPFLTETGAAGKLYETLTNSGVNRYGEPNQDAIQIGARLIGFNFYPVVPEMQRARNINNMKRDLNDVVGRMNMVRTDQSIPDDEKEEKIQHYVDEIVKRQGEIEKYAADSDVPGFLLKRED